MAVPSRCRLLLPMPTCNASPAAAGCRYLQKYKKTGKCTIMNTTQAMVGLHKEVGKGWLRAPCWAEVLGAT